MHVFIFIYMEYYGIQLNYIQCFLPSSPRHWSSEMEEGVLIPVLQLPAVA